MTSAFKQKLTRIAARSFVFATLLATPFLLASSLQAQGAPPQGAPPAGQPGAAPGGGQGRGGGGGFAFPTAAEMQGKNASQVFKNVQALSSIPADQLLPSMTYITQALGVGCNFCHVPGQFDNDQKPQKVMARSMMKMVLTENASTFGGQRKLTCYTCHRGQMLPLATPVIPSVAAAPAGGPGGGQGGGRGAGGGQGGPNAQQAPAAPPLPSVDDILAKYTDALGGQAAVTKLMARSSTGTVQQGNQQPSNIEEYRKSPNMATSTTHGGRGDTSQGFDGKNGWSANAFQGSTDTTGDALVRLQAWAEFLPGLNMKKNYTRTEVTGIEQIDGKDVYVVAAYHDDDPDRFYFDKDSGLLTRMFNPIRSFLGDMPQETTYSDYRDVNGVKVPFGVRVATVQNAQMYKWDSVDGSAAVDASKFAKPNIAPAPPGQGRGGAPGGGAPGVAPAGGPGGAPPAAPGGGQRPAGQ